jgi:hypothetical protein
MMRAGYAVTGAAYRPLAWRGRSRGEGCARSFADLHAARGFVRAGGGDRHHGRAGVELVNERDGLVHDYTRRGGVEDAFIVVPVQTSAGDGFDALPALDQAPRQQQTPALDHEQDERDRQRQRGHDRDGPDIGFGR